MAQAFPKSGSSATTSTRLDRRRDGACAAHGVGNAPSRSAGRRTSPAAVRPHHLLRLPARHGRSGSRGRAYPAALSRRRHLDGGRAHGRRHAGGESQPRRAPLLFGLDDDLRPDLAGAGDRNGARRPSRRERLAEVIRSGGFTRSAAPPRPRSTWCWRRPSRYARIGTEACGLAPNSWFRIHAESQGPAPYRRGSIFPFSVDFRRDEIGFGNPQRDRGRQFRRVIVVVGVEGVPVAITENGPGPPVRQLHRGSDLEDIVGEIRTRRVKPAAWPALPSSVHMRVSGSR